MSKTKIELKSLVDSIEMDGFRQLRDKYRERQGQLYGHQSYKELVVKNLHPSIKEKIAVPSAVPWISARQIEGILRVSLSFHVEPPPDKASHNRSPAKQRADRAELFYAYLWHCLDQNGRVSSDTRRYQAVAPFAAWWLSYEAFELPKTGQEEYRSRYWPFKLDVVDPYTVGFVPDGKGNTLSCLHYNLRYYEINRRYGGVEAGDDDKHALQVFNQKFKFLRAGRGEEVDRASYYTKSAEVWVLDDLNTCCHAIAIDRGDGKEYEQVTDDYPNPWGESPLSLILGGYNVDAPEMEDRYESLLEGLFREQRSLDITDSHYASIALNPPKAIEQLPAEVAARLEMDDTDREVLFSDAGITSIMGTLAQLNFPIDPMFREFRASRASDRDKALPPPFLTNPDQGVVKYGDVTAQLQAVETSNRLYDAARESFVAGIHGVCRKAAHFIKYGYPGFNVKGAPKEEKVYFSPKGTIPAKMASSKYIGGTFEVGPSDFDDGDSLDISIVATSQAQKQMDFNLALLKWQSGFGTWETVAATTTEDVSGLKLAVEEERRYQQNVEVIDNLQLLSDLEAVVLEGGPDLSQLYLAGMGAQQQGPQGSPPKQDTGMNVQTAMAPPMDNTNGVMATG